MGTEEGKEIMDECKMPALMPASRLGSAVEHYEISRYGTLKTWANVLGYKDAVQLRCHPQGRRTDSALSQLAESEVNPTARKRRRSTGPRRMYPWKAPSIRTLSWKANSSLRLLSGRETRRRERSAASRQATCEP
jgi:hypothetical protein